MLHLGVDLGSKTVKLAVLDDDANLLDYRYERHLSNVPLTLAYQLSLLANRYPTESFSVGVTGSAGMQLSQLCGLLFEQEVIATRAAIERYIPETDVAIEIGGEDSKILYVTGGEELRMNNTCAGGTGSFIDTVAGMMDLNAQKLNVFAHGARTIYPIASRCAVFAQSDVRPLLNEGVSKEDIAASTFDAVVSQCVGGLACGRPIRGKVAFLGGPLHFLSALRDAFCKRLGLADSDVILPNDAHVFVAQGAALLGWDTEPATLAELQERIQAVDWNVYESLERLEPLFESEGEYRAFVKSHEGEGVRRQPLNTYEGDAYLGVDSGSEALKYVLMGQDGQILRAYYQRSAGDIVEMAREMLIDLLKSIPLGNNGEPLVTIRHATVTGYGESYLKEAFSFDSGEVETIAHVWAARAVDPQVDFLLDIGGQDIKCTYLANGNIDNVVLNEACSSGCGALLSGMAWSMNVKIEDFVNEALFAPSPVDLGTRCTVFMTSRVRHAQKEGASLGDISAGLAYSVVRNAVQKVIRANHASDLGSHIVVQGGTFANDAVLRAFEKHYGVHVVRPEAPQVMGAYGAALLARERAREGEESSLISLDQIRDLTFAQETRTCELCPNSCHMTVTAFTDGAGLQRSFSLGNRCERGAGRPLQAGVPNLYDLKCAKLFDYEPLAAEDAPRGEMGVLRALSTYELYPLWHTMFTQLGYRVVLSSESSAGLFRAGMESVPSESMCYPGKLVFGHAIDLVERGVRRIFAPYVHGVRDRQGLCPVAGASPLALALNVDAVQREGVELLSPTFFGVLIPDEREMVVDSLCAALSTSDDAPTRSEVMAAFDAGVVELERFESDMRAAARAARSSVAQKGVPAVVLAGRPYHLDREVHHGIPDMLRQSGYAVLTDDAVLDAEEGFAREGAHWEYPDRVVAAAKAAAQDDGLDFVQLHSFSCGPDALATDLVRDELDRAGKPFAAIKIDEMVDVASARIRVRSMKAVRDHMRYVASAALADEGAEDGR